MQLLFLKIYALRLITIIGETIGTDANIGSETGQVAATGTGTVTVRGARIDKKSAQHEQ